MAELIAGAVLGTLTSELYTLVENLIKKYKQFSPLLDDIKSTLDSLKPLTEQIEGKNNELNLSNNEIEKFKDRISDGIKLLRECSDDPKWYKKVTYTKKLNDLDESLKRQLAILTAHGVRDGKETLGLARKHAEQLSHTGKEIMKAMKEANTGVQGRVSYFWNILIVAAKIIGYLFYAAIGIILVPIVFTYFTHSLALPSGKTLPFLGSTGTLLVLVLCKIVNFITGWFLFIFGFAFWLNNVKETYNKGYWRWTLRDFIWLGGCTSYFLYCCLLFFTPLGCQL